MNTDLRDILITRAVDGRARPEDWEAIERLAQTEPVLWREIALAQRDDRALASAVMHQVSRADHVELPEAELAEMTHEHSRAVVSRRTRLAATWSGWAAAALIGIAAVSRDGTGNADNNFTPGIAALPGSGVIGTASDALDRYLDLGRKDGTVLGEMPEKLLVRSSKSADGDGYEVVYVRQIIERARVPGLYKLSSDEAGNATPVPITSPITIPHMDILPTGDDGPM